jgi:hypothetical protein
MQKPDLGDAKHYYTRDYLLTAEYQNDFIENYIPGNRKKPFNE